MWNRLSNTEKYIFAIATFAALLFLYLLVDDSWLDFSIANDNSKEIGFVVEKENDVRFKRSNQFSWKKASRKIHLNNGDSLFTGSNSKSIVKLKDGTEVEIDENALVVFNFTETENGLDFKYKVISGSVSYQNKENQKVVITDTKTKKKKPETVNKTVMIPQKKSDKLLRPPRILFPNSNYNHEIAYDEFDKTKSARNLNVKWKGSLKKSEYEYQLSTQSDFSEPIDKKSINSQQTTTCDLTAGQYFVRVREKVGAQISEWSKVHSFTVTEKWPHKLPAPILTKNNIYFKAPAKGLPTIAWKKVENADHYLLQLSKTSDFTSKIDFKSTQLNFKWTNYEKGQYFFRVYAVKKSGVAGLSSEVGKIKIVIDKPLLSPVEPKEIFGKSPDDPGEPQEYKVEWTKLPIADSYQIQVAEDEKFTAPLQFEAKDANSVLTIPKPGTFKWRVRPLDASGKPITNFSDLGSIVYNLKVPLATPSLLEPDENITLYFQQNIPQVFWIEWSSVRQAEAYKLEIAKDPEFTNPVLTEIVADTKYLIQRKLPQGRLFWRVMAVGPDRTSHWSQARRMTVFAGRSAGIHNREEQQ